MREEMGVAQSGLQRVVQGAFGLLDLLAFFTAGEESRRSPGTCGAADRLARRGRDPLRHPAWLRAPEVIGWQELVDAADTRGRASAAPSGWRGRTTDGRRGRNDVKFTP